MLLLIRGITVLNSLVSVSIFIGVTLFVFLLFKRSQKSYANIFLAFIILLYVLCLIPGYLYGGHWLKYVPHLSNIGGQLFPLFGPLIFFYTKANTQRGFRLERANAFHLIPFFLFLIADPNFFSSSGAEKIEAYERFLINGIYVGPKWMQLAKVTHGIIYYIFTIRMIFLYKKHMIETSSNIDQVYYRWLLFYSSVLMMPLLSITIIVFTQYNMMSITMFALSFSFLIISVYLAILFKPTLFNRFPNRMEPIAVIEEERKKYENSNLQDTQKERLVKKLLDYVEKEKPYLEPELTLGQLSEQVNIPAHYLSQIINEKIEKTFGDFINGYRVEQAKAMLIDEQYSHYTIISTAYEAGFNSKTAFYTAFKKFTGKTPSQYRKLLNVN